MKTEYKYICFIKVQDKPKTSVWHCLNQKSDGLLGTVKWYGPWRQYCFFPETDTVFNIGCLEDINHFIDQLGEVHKQLKILTDKEVERKTKVCGARSNYLNTR